MPYSLIFFAITGIVFILQLIPFTGIFLMFLGAAFWSVFTINAGFVSLAVEAFLGRVSRFWVAAPIAWFGGYLAFAAMNHIAFNDLAAEIERHNAGRSMPFSSETAALVIASNSDNLSSAASTLVRSYDLPVAYVANPNFKTASHLAYRIGAGETCTRIRADTGFGSAGIHAFGFHESGKLVKDMCQFQAPEDPKISVVTVTATTEKRVDWWFPNIVDSIQITAASGQAVELKSGYAAPVKWFPQPLLGCFLNSGAASWDCFASFSREKMQGLGSEGAYGGSTIHVIAEALQLKPSPATQRRKTIENSKAPPLEKIVESRVLISLSNLDRLIADPTQHITVHDFAGLREKSDLLGPRAEGMSAALVKTLDAGLRSRESSLNLQRLIAVLEPRDFFRVSGGLLAAFEARPMLDKDMIGEELPSRFGDIGSEAITLLDRMAFGTKNSGSAAAILGLCRIGKPAAALSDKVANILMSTKRTGTSNRHSAAFITLLRMGRPDLADQDPDAGSYYRADSYAKLRQTITPESPADVCLEDWHWQRMLKVKS